MSTYDFHTLNDKEFEVLIADLISAHENVLVERFKSGQDQGIDGRFYKVNDKPIIIQCKHWLKSGVKKLISHLKTVEYDKVKKLNPSRYIFVTSLELSPEDKKLIKNIFAPYIKVSSDILGNDEINSLISKHKEIEAAHYKLWISSVNVMQSILHADVIGRSGFVMDEIITASTKYVISKSHDDAIDKIEKENVLIVTGMPGVGKTSLAEQVALKYIANKFQFVCIESSISEAEKVYKNDKKQIFYFDDFLGRNYLQAIENKEDSHIVNFIKRVSSDKKKKFILTSRTSILNDGKIASDLFSINNIDKNEYEVKVGAYTRLDKGKILYNHIWFGDLNEGYIESIYKEKRYINIIEHANYNPRLISFITDSHKISSVTEEDYWAYIENTLNNPSGIWGYIFENQLNDLDKLLVSIITFNNENISEFELKRCFEEASSELKINHNLNSLEFTKSIKLLVGSVINRNIKENGDVYFTLFDPSVGDYVLELYSNEETYISNIISALHTVSSFRNLKGMEANNIINTASFEVILMNLMDYRIKCDDMSDMNEYSLKLINNIINNTDVKNYVFIESIRQYILSIEFKEIQSIPLMDYIDIIEWDIDNLVIRNEMHHIYLHLFEMSSNYFLDTDELVRLSGTIETLISMFESGVSEDEGDRITESLKENVVSQLKETIHDDVSNNANVHDTLDDSLIHSEAESYTEMLLDEFNISFDYSDVDEIVSHVDTEQIVEDNKDHMHDRNDEYNESTQSSNETTNIFNVDPVIDLFDRG